MIEEVLIKPFPIGLELVRDKRKETKEERDYPRCFSPWEISLINAFKLMDEGYKRKGKKHVIGSLRLHIISSKGTGVISLTEIRAKVVYVSAVIDSEPIPEEGMLFKSLHWLGDFITGK